MLTEAYTRTVVAADDHAETLLMRWNPGIRCAPHDHGEASGAIHLITGRFVERRYRFDGASLTVVETLHHAAPALVPVAPFTIHDMVSDTGGVSVHHYTPRISGMQVYNHVLRETLVVSDDCGAWVPTDATLIMERTPWQLGR